MLRKHWKLILEIDIESIRAGLNVNFNIHFPGLYVNIFDLFGLKRSLSMRNVYSFKLFGVQVARLMSLFAALN